MCPPPPPSHFILLQKWQINTQLTQRVQNLFWKVFWNTSALRARTQIERWSSPRPKVSFHKLFNLLSARTLPLKIHFPLQHRHLTVRELNCASLESYECHPEISGDSALRRRHTRCVCSCISADIRVTVRVSSTACSFHAWSSPNADQHSAPIPSDIFLGPWEPYCNPALLC